MVESLLNNLLPAEMLEQVFRLLPPRDLKMAVLVCSWWREVGEVPALWSWVTLKVSERNLVNTREVLNTRRMRAVRRLEVRAMLRPRARDELEDLLQAIAKHQGLRELVLGDIDLSQVDERLLARAVTRVEVLDMYDASLTCLQATAVFASIQEGTRLKVLNLVANNLSEVDSAVLGKSVALLEEAYLSRTRLAPQQVEAIFEALGRCSHLRTLSLLGNNLSSVEANELAREVNKLETADLRHTNLNSQQISRVLRQSLVATSLKQLHMGDRVQVDKELFLQARHVIPDLIVLGNKFFPFS